MLERAFRYREVGIESLQRASLVEKTRKSVAVPGTWLNQ